MDDRDLLIWRDFERDLTIAKRSPRTIQSHQETVQQLIDFTAGRWCSKGCEHQRHDRAPLDEMTKAHIQDYILEVMARHSDQTALVRFSSLRKFFNWMVDDDAIEESPMRKMEAPKPERKIINVPAVEDVRKILAVCEPRTKPADFQARFNNLRDAAIIRLFVEPGSPRVNEMANIEVGYLDMRTDAVTFKGKGAKWRGLAFSNKTGKAVSRYLRIRPEHPLVVAARRTDPASDGPPQAWLGWRGKPLAASGIYQMMKRRCEEAGVAHIHPHALRHLATHLFYEKGGTEQEAMFLFGWDDPAMAHHYAKQLAGKRAMASSRRLGIGDDL
ncbi:tyrosine-type recombinase/integrase [Spirillospora sp. NPDC127200]